MRVAFAAQYLVRAPVRLSGADTIDPHLSALPQDEEVWAT